jgi:hypothetical protein
MNKIKLVRYILREDQILKHHKILPYIDNFVFKIISIGAKRKIFSHYERFLAHGELPKNVEEVIILANYKTRGKIRRKIRKSNNEINSDFNSKFFSKSTLERTVKELNDFGFSYIGSIQSDEIFSELEKLKNMPVFSRKLNLKREKNVTEITIPDPSLDHIWSVQPEKVLENSGFQKLVLDGFWKQVADSYLGAPTKISALRCWYSFPHSNKFDLTPENWHLDAGDGLNFIKFFLLLSDVEELSGPTSVIPVPSNILPKKFYTGRRYSDSEINNLMLKNNVKEIKATGKAGTIYVIDTRLIHRGTPVSNGSRFLVNWMASVDQFGSISRENYKLKPDNPLAHRSDLM